MSTQNILWFNKTKILFKLKHKQNFVNTHIQIPHFEINLIDNLFICLIVVGVQNIFKRQYIIKH